VNSVSVFFERERLPAVAEWQVAINRAGFPLRLDAAVDLATAEGMIPAEYAGEATGFECYLEMEAELPEGAPFHAEGPALRACAVLVSRSTTEMLAAVAAAAALAQLTSGVLYDDPEARAYGPDEAIAWALQIIDEIRP
jgi:hypothetical protein